MYLFFFLSIFHTQAKVNAKFYLDIIIIRRSMKSLFNQGFVHTYHQKSTVVSLQLFLTLCVNSKGLHPTHFQTVRKTSTASVNEPSTCLFLEPSKAAIKISSLHISQLRLRLFLNSCQLYRPQKNFEYICRIQVTTPPFRIFDFKGGTKGPAKGLLLKNINILVIQLIALISAFGAGILCCTLAERYHKQGQNCRFIRTYGRYELIWPNLSK